MSFLPETLCLHRVARMPYLSLPTGPQCQVTYIWVNTVGKLPKAKTRTLDSEPQSITDVPLWYATYSIPGRTCEQTLVPVRMFRDPFTLDPNKLVLCEARDLEGRPAPGQWRSACAEAMEAVKDQEPWFGFEQEYLLMALDGLPFGWRTNEPPSTGVTADVGLGLSYGRDVSLSHYLACLYAGVLIDGTTSETIPAQWEYQIGPCGGTELGDHAWVARYILFRVCEDFGVVPSLHPKPLSHPRWCSGGHMNFSTADMRAEGGITHIHAAIERLSRRHGDHMAVYGGDHNALRLNGQGLNSSFEKFSWRTSSRKSSVRVPGHVHRDGRGYLEDRRPSADCDPYQVCRALVQTCLLLGDGEEDVCADSTSADSDLLPPGDRSQEDTCPRDRSREDSACADTGGILTANQTPAVVQT